MTRSRRLLLLLALTALGTSTLAQSAVPQSPVQANQQALLERLLRMNNPQAANVVTLGAVPDTLPITFNPAVQIQATVRSVYPGGTPNYRVLAVSSGDLETARQALATDLLATGWQPIPQTPVRGFRPTEGAAYTGFFWEGRYPLVLNSTVQAVVGKVELDITATATTAQNIAVLKKSARGYPQSSMPVLSPMPGAQVKAAQYSYSAPQGMIISARVTTTTSANEVLSFYSQQLRKAGWKAVTDTQSGTLRVVTYLLTDLNQREVVGVLVIRTQANGDYILTASIDGFKPI